jgi:hypothetical protein
MVGLGKMDGSNLWAGSEPRPRVRAMIAAAADPNWFYSTLAQATAALVGLAGAFLLQRLISQREEVGVPRQDIRLDCLNLRRRMQQEGENARALLDGLETAIGEARGGGAESGVVTIAATVNVLGPDGGVSGQNGLPEFPRGEAIKILEDARAAVVSFSEAIEAARFEALVKDIRLDGRLAAPEARWLLDGKPHAGAQIADPRLAPWPRLETQDRFLTLRWKTHVRASEELGERLGRLRARLVPQPFYFLFVVLLILLLAGVIVPLIFLARRADPRSGSSLLSSPRPRALSSDSSAGNCAACAGLTGFSRKPSEDCSRSPSLDLHSPTRACTRVRRL